MAGKNVTIKLAELLSWRGVRHSLNERQQQIRHYGDCSKLQDSGKGYRRKDILFPSSLYGSFAQYIFM